MLIAWLAPWHSLGAKPAAEPVRFHQVRAVIQARCVACHNAQAQQKGVALHTAELIGRHAPAIHQQAVVQRTMPMSNATAITDEERALIGRWFAAGAPLR